jgi:4-phytase/acid phosphatase
MIIKVISLVLGLVLVLDASEASAQDNAPLGKLVRIVMLSRHGVRPPLQESKILNEWLQSSSATPTWPALSEWFRRDAPPNDGAPVCAGYLTNHGAYLMRLMGVYYRHYLENEKLLIPGLCQKDDVFIWSDIDERTQATAEAIVGGLAPQCSARITIKGDPNPYIKRALCNKTTNPDPLFHPTTTTENKLKNCSLDPKKMPTLDGLTQALKPQIEKAQAILKCCSKELCGRERPALEACQLSQLSSSIEPTSEKATPQHVQASVKGGLNIAQSLAEILMLEYAQFGLVDHGQKFGFGRANEPDMLDILKIHTQVFTKVQRDDHVALRQGGNLLHHLSYAIEHGTDPSEPNGSKKFIAYIGHDTNIANVAGILHLHWRLPKYPDDDMPPGSALIFEVRMAPDAQGRDCAAAEGKCRIYVFFVSQSPDKMRSADSVFCAQFPDETSCTELPDKKPVSICKEGSCSIAEFSMAEFIELTTKPLANEEWRKDCALDGP